MAEFDGVTAGVKAELTAFARNRQLTDWTIKIRTVTTSVDAVLKDQLPGRKAALAKLNRDAVSLGVLRHLTSVYINMLVEDPDPQVAQPGRELVFDQNGIHHIFMGLSGNKLRNPNKGSPRLIEKAEFKKVRDHLSSFVNERIGLIPEEVRCGWTTIPRHAAQTVSKEMLVAMKQHVFTHFGACVKYLRCLTEERLWEFRNSPNFKDLIEAASSVLYRSCMSASEEEARKGIERFCVKKRVPSWEHSLLLMMDEYRTLLSEVRGRTSLTSKNWRLFPSSENVLPNCKI